ETSQVIDRYKLLEQIGEGGFGVVYMAEQQEPIRRRVALKIIKLGMDTKQIVARFEAERQALAMMDHENIASVYDAGATETGRPYFVMELVRGVPITEYCDGNRLNTADRLRLFVSVCKAVQHAHQKGIIHRDLKPSNVMVTLRGGTPVPKVIDFGIAKATQLRLTDKTIFTRYGQFIGTPCYMSPEQVEMSELDVDTRSDVYSLGVLLYELLTGSTPVEQQRLKHASYSEIQRIICEQEPARPSARLSRSGAALATISTQRNTQPKKLTELMRGELDWIVMKALEKDRTRRYDTANGLAADVSRYLNNEPVEASPTSATYKLRKFAGRHRKWIAAASAFALLLVAGSIVSVLLALRAMQAEGRAVYNERLANQRYQQQQQATREMKAQRDLAKELGAKLSDQLAETDRAAEFGRNLLYVAHMNLIQQELRTGNDSRVIELLNHHRPVAGQRDLRGFEWYYVWGLCHRHRWSWRHYTAIGCVAHNPAGTRLATGCPDGSVQVWDAQSGRILAAVRGHRGAVVDIAFSPDGQTILSG
ncbi:MAG: serine/threonine-protein kinase, partial [Pirellulales bacterium]|nr:serine/threonine-protein kinase [Pirellulales bacterium]